jgi:hypothetical protein
MGQRTKEFIKGDNMTYKNIVKLCKQFNIVPIEKDFFKKGISASGWIVNDFDSCMWTEAGLSFDGGRHCSSLAFIENIHHLGMNKNQIWDSIAEAIEFEGKDIYECDCGECKDGTNNIKKSLINKTKSFLKESKHEKSISS